MRSRLLLILLIVGLNVFSQVPNTTTFTLQDVVDEVNPTTDDLQDCFSDAIADYFNPTYEGSKNSLLNFRDYGSHNSIDMYSYLSAVWEMDNLSWPQTNNVANAPLYSNVVPFPSVVSGLITMAINLSSSSYYAWTDAVTYSPNTISVSMWVKGNAPSLTEECIFRFTGNGLGLYLVGTFEPGIYYVYIKDINFQISPPQDAMNENDWNHIVVTRSPTELHLYTNGVLQYSNTGMTYSSSSNSAVSVGGYGVPSTWVGLYDQVVVYEGRQIGINEVQYLYNSGNGRAYINW
jgi:hypothetical protein